MTETQYRLFLSAGAFVCGLGVLVNLARLRSRGTSALLLASAFLTLAGILWLLRSHADSAVVSAAGVLLAVLLIADVVVRARAQGTPPR